ncbi:unnamed protein product, partial [Mesorhabditis spiculigera]
MPVECRVCSNPKGVFRYYGASVCAPCKVFFLRAVQNKETYICGKDGECPITPERWTKTCRACRYQKCISVDMDPKAVGTSKAQKKRQRAILEGCDDPLWPKQTVNHWPALVYEAVSYGASTRLEDLSDKALRSIKPRPAVEVTEEYNVSNSAYNWVERSVCPYFADKPVKLNMTIDRAFRTSAIGDEYLAFLRCEDPRKLVRKLVELESHCYMDQASIYEPVHENMDLPFAEALKDPLRCGRRTPLDWNNKVFRVPTMIDTIKKVYCRLTVYYIDWLRGLPEMTEICGSERLRLVSDQLAATLMTSVIYHSYKTGCPGLALSCGYHYMMGRREGHEFDFFLDRLAAYGHDHIATIFREIDITFEEFCIVKMISFCTAHHALGSEKAGNVLQHARRKYEWVLGEHVRTKYAHLSDYEKARRIEKLSSLPLRFQQMGIMDNAYIRRMVMLDICGFSAPLTYDIHMREFN